MNPRHLIFTLYGILLAGLSLWAGTIFLNAREEYGQLKRQQAEIRRLLDRRRSELAENEKILERLRHDPDYVEQVLRKRHHAKPGEIIFNFPN